MKNLDLPKLLGSGIVSLSIIISGFIVANKLPQTPYVPDRLYVTSDNETPAVKEFMSAVEAAFFITMSENDLKALVNSGELDGTFFISNESYVFSKEKLTQWMFKQIDEFSISR